MNCPHCNIEMGTTYEPYEYRCGKCGYWFDTYTGKEVTFAPPVDEDDYDDSAESRICSVCNGTGGDRWNDGIMPCPECDGEGYLYWLP
jgi:rubredoxin